MTFNFKTGIASFLPTGDIGLLITVPREYKTQLDELNKLLELDKVKTVEVKQFREKRSLDANAALWKMLSMMAEKLGTDKDTLYLDYLQKYGVFTHVIVKPNAVDRIKSEWRTVVELGEVTINGKTGIQLQCYFGSSQLDSKEFSVLLQGVIDEAKELGIEFISKEDFNRMMNEWGAK